MQFLSQVTTKLKTKLQEKARAEERRYEQSQAIVDWMYLILLADLKIGIREREYVAQCLSELPWRPNQSMDSYISRTIARIREAHQHRGILVDLVAGMGDRMRSLELQEVARQHLDSLVQDKRSASWVLVELEKAL